MKARKGKKFIQNALQGVLYIVIFGVVPIVAAHYVLSSDTPSVNAGLDFLKKLSVPSPENQKFWGMSSFELFGRPFIYNQNQPSETLGNSESRVYIPIWIEGEKLDGTKGKWIRLVHLTSFQDNTAVASLQENIFNESKISNFQAGEEKPLTMGKQFGTWLIWSMFGPGLLLLYSITFFGDNLPIYKILQIVIGILSFPMAGYLAHTFFNSLFAVLICLTIYSLIFLSLLKVLLLLRSRLTAYLEQKGKGKSLAIWMEEGIAHLSKGETQEAIDSFFEALKIADQVDDQAGRVLILTYIAKSWKKKGDRQMAEIFYQHALDAAREAQDMGFITSIENELSEL